MTVLLGSSQVEKFNTDPLIYRDKVTVGTGYALLQAIEKLGPRIGDIKFPFLCIHGEADKLADVHGAKLLEDTPSTDKTISVSLFLIDLEKNELQQLNFTVHSQIFYYDVTDTVIDLSESLPSCPR